MGEDQNMVALVTGAGRGIGRAVALRLAGMGAKVAVNYSASEDKAREVAQEIISAGGSAMVLGFDVSDPGQVEEGFARLMDEFGRIDVLVNNAGVVRDGLLVRMKEEDWDRVLAVNLKGAFLCLRAVAKPMMKQRSGRIVNIGSVMGFLGSAGQVNYSASKAGLIGLTKSAARELAARSITVNLVAPGFIETDMTAVLSDKVKAAYLDMIPLKRFGAAEDVANAVAFLAGEEAGYITGQVIHVNGGIYM